MKKIAIVVAAAAVLSSVPAMAGDVGVRFFLGLPVPVVTVSEPAHRVYVPEREYHHEMNCRPRYVEARYWRDRDYYGHRGEYYRGHERRWDRD